MGCYICMRCGNVDNTAVGGYWNNVRKGEPVQCSRCNRGKWHKKFLEKPWSEYGDKKKMLELEARKDGSMLNASEYFNSIREQVE